MKCFIFRHEISEHFQRLFREIRDTLDISTPDTIKNIFRYRKVSFFDIFLDFLPAVDAEIIFFIIGNVIKLLHEPVGSGFRIFGDILFICLYDIAEKSEIAA